MDYPMNFIKAGNDFTTFEKSVPAPYLRRSFDVKETPETAELIITGLGIYELYLNGENITKGLLAPYRSNPDNIIYYDKYDVSEKLNKGKNTIGLVLGNGILNAPGAYVWEFDKAKYISAPMTAFSLKINYGEDDNQTVISDEQTKTFPSPIIFDDLHFGEYYDARREISGWNLPEFNDSDWNKAIKADTPRGEARICTAEPIKVRNTLKPVNIIKLDDSFIYDFGKNGSGLCKLVIKGFKGQKLILKYFETLVNGRPHFDNNRFRSEDRYQEDEYYCSGNGTENYTPRFTYHGFRYVLVMGITEEQATQELLTYLEISSDLGCAGEFKCSDDTINKIQNATVRSDYSNFYYFPTDCPQREKNGWTADASLSSEQMLLNITPENSYKEWMRNIYKAMADNGQLPGIIPTSGWGYHWGNGPAWDNVIINLPYYTYVYRGDKEILNELSIPLMRYLNYLYSRLNEKGLMEIGLGDWCQPARSESDYDAPLVVTDTILTYDIANKAAFVYDVLGNAAQKQFAMSLANKVKSAFRENLIDYNSMEIEGTCQTCQAMAIYYGMLTDDEKKKAFDVLLKYIDNADGHFKTGVLGGRIIYRLLADNGMADLAFDMVVRPDFPSYGNWIKRGATTLWEAFWMEENGRILSLNHHFWGDISAWFYTYLAGIKVNTTGRDITNIDVKPCFVKKLTNVDAYHNTPNGKIAVKWDRTPTGITLEVNSAEKLHGVIELPYGYVFENGTTCKPLKTGIYKIMCQ